MDLGVGVKFCNHHNNFQVTTQLECYLFYTKTFNYYTAIFLGANFDFNTCLLEDSNLDLTLTELSIG